MATRKCLKCGHEWEPKLGTNPANCPNRKGWKCHKWDVPVTTNTLPMVERFWIKVSKGDGCWIWDSADDGGRGYGQFWWGKRKYRATHVAWFLTHGKWPEGLMCHRCDNPRCVRPDHLFVGTSKDNSIDCVHKGRQSKKLSPEQVRTIRQLRAAGFLHRQLAEMFEVDRVTISNLLSGKSWAWLN